MRRIFRLAAAGWIRGRNASSVQASCGAFFVIPKSTAVGNAIYVTHENAASPPLREVVSRPINATPTKKIVHSFRSLCHALADMSVHNIRSGVVIPWRSSSTRPQPPSPSPPPGAAVDLVPPGCALFRLRASLPLSVRPPLRPVPRTAAAAFARCPMSRFSPSVVTSRQTPNFRQPRLSLPVSTSDGISGLIIHSVPCS